MLAGRIVFPRISSKVFLLVLLMASAVILFLPPAVNSQEFSYSTVTSLITNVQTTTLQTTSYPVSPAGSLQFGTHGYWSSTQLGGKSYFMTILSYAGSACSVSWLSFQSQKGLRITFALSADDAIDFFIIPATNWREGVCNYSPTQFVLEAQQVTTYSLDWTAPDVQQYYLLFLYRGYGTNNGIVLSSFLALNQASTMQTQTIVVQTTQLLTSIQTYVQTKTFEVPFLEANVSWLLPVILIAIATALFIVMRARRRTGRRKAK